MIRIFTYIALSIFTSSICFSQTVKEIEKEMVLSHKIKAKLQTDFKYENDKVQKTGKLSSKTSFDKNGNIIEKQYFGSKQEVLSWEKYEYDENGNRTLFERSSATGQYKKESTYDDEDKIILETGYDGAQPFKTTYKYSPNGKPLEITYSFSNQVDEKRVYEYHGNQAEVKVLSGGKVLVSMISLYFDEKDNLIKETVKGKDGNIEETKNYTYSATSMILIEQKEKAGVLDYRISYKYDSKDNLISVSEETSTVAKFIKKEFSYDAKGNLEIYKWRRKASEEFNIKTYTSDDKDIWISEHTYYPATKYQSLSKYTYEHY